MADVTLNEHPVPIAGTLPRQREAAAVALDESNRVLHAQLLHQIADEPACAAALTALK